MILKLYWKCLDKIKGPPSKSEYVRRFVKLNKAESISIDLHPMEAGDLTGLPILTDEEKKSL